jgi:hypothetical protein
VLAIGDQTEYLMVGEPEASTMILLTKQGLVLAELVDFRLPALETEEILEGFPEGPLRNFRNRNEEMREVKSDLLR